ncbi:exported hypothetical protein [Mesorhizobium sp. SOD10]|nr:exported hypothetical protein [Mesorhizobium sp. SOD10]
MRRKRRRSIRSSALIAIISLVGRWESTLLKQASAHGYRFLRAPYREAATPTSRKINATRVPYLL